MQRSEAEEHLRIIRSLMEKATIYRAVLAPTALIGGLLSLAVGITLAGPMRHMAETPIWFYGPWLVVLIVTGAINGLCLYREAQRRGDPFFSPGMRMALRALIPSHIVAAFSTLLVIGHPAALFENGSGLHFVVPAIWCVAYGLGLLAMEHFAPRSLVCLGWAFLVTGLIAFAIWHLGYFATAAHHGYSAGQIANLTMALTFGVYHIVYAACSWPRVGLSENRVGA